MGLVWILYERRSFYADYDGQEFEYQEVHGVFTSYEKALDAQKHGDGFVSTAIKEVELDSLEAWAERVETVKIARERFVASELAKKEAEAQRKTEAEAKRAELERQADLAESALRAKPPVLAAGATDNDAYLANILFEDVIVCGRNVADAYFASKTPALARRMRSTMELLQGKVLNLKDYTEAMQVSNAAENYFAPWPSALSSNTSFWS